MGEQTQKNEDAELHEDSEEEEYEDLEHPDPGYEYVYPGAPPKRYDSARKDPHNTDDIEEPEDASEDTPEDTHESRKDDDANQTPSYWCLLPAS